MARLEKCPECGRMTLRLSWSQLRNFETCQERAWHIRQGRRATMENQRVFFPGTVTDRVVRDWLNNGHEPGVMPDMVEEIMVREWDQIVEDGGTITWKNANDRNTVAAECREAVTRIEPALNKFVTPYDFQPDMRFQAPVSLPHPGGGTEQVLLIGAMDILVNDDKKRWWVWDVKHTKDNSYWRKTEGQLTFYDLAVELMFGKPTVRTGLLQPLCTEQVKPFEITPDKRQQMLQRIVAMARSIWNDEHPPRQDTTECGWCSVKHACSKFAPVADPKGKRRVAI